MLADEAVGRIPIYVYRELLSRRGVIEFVDDSTLEPTRGSLSVTIRTLIETAVLSGTPMNDPVLATNVDIVEAFLTTNSDGKLVIGLRISEEGTIRLRQYSRDHIGDRIAVLSDGRLLIAPTIVDLIPSTDGGMIIEESTTLTRIRILNYTLAADPYSAALCVIDAPQPGATTSPCEN